MHLGCPSPPKCITRSCFSFLLGITAFPREIENNAYAKFGGQTSCIMGDVQVANTNSRSETFPDDPSFSMLATQSWRTKDFKIPATSCSSFASFLPYFNKKFPFRLQWKVNGNFYARLLLSFTLLLSGVFFKVTALSGLFIILTRWHWPHLEVVIFFSMQNKSRLTSIKN